MKAYKAELGRDRNHFMGFTIMDQENIILTHHPPTSTSHSLLLCCPHFCVD